MLKSDYTKEIIEHIHMLWEWEVLNRPMIDSIIIDTENNLGELGLTAYNIRQIMWMKTEDLSWWSTEEVAQSIIHNSYDKNFVKTFKRVKELDYVKKSRLLWNSNDFLEHTKTFLESYTPKEARPFQANKPNNGKSLVIALTDLHIWKKWSDLINERLHEIVDDIVSTNVEHVEIFCVWDLVETLVQWGMHDGQIEAMWNIYWFDLMMKVVEIFENFLIGIATCWITVNFYWISGNHDRMTKDREGDKARLGWLIMYELIKRWLMNIEWIQINIIQDYITTADIEDVRYIVAHWDMTKIPKRKGSDIAWNHWDNTMSHNVILYWHLHNISVTEEKGITKIGLPWLAWTDQYATKELDLHSEPAYVQIIHNKHNSVDLLIKRLTHD